MRSRFSAWLAGVRSKTRFSSSCTVLTLFCLLLRLALRTTIASQYFRSLSSLSFPALAHRATNASEVSSSMSCLEQSSPRVFLTTAAT